MYFGEQGLIRFDQKVRYASTNQATHVGLPKVDLPGKPSWLGSGLVNPSSQANARTKIRIYAAPVATPKIPADLAGTWSGTVRQTEPSLAVTVRISLTAGRSAGTISYPQLGCSGRLLLVSVLSGTFTLDQGITKGQQSCDNGTVLLSPQGNSALSFKFRRSDAPSPAGVLTRTGA